MLNWFVKRNEEGEVAQVKMERVIAAGLAALFSLWMILQIGIVQIEDGETGVKIDFGKIQDETASTGWHFYFRPFTQIEVWNVKTNQLKEIASVPSSEGLISSLDISVLYYVPKEKAVFIRKTIGPNYLDTVLEPYVREAIRNVASGYMVKALFSDAGRKEIGEGILKFLREKLEPRGILIQDVLLRDVKLPEQFSQSIQQKLKTEQEALQKEFELQKAKKDAEIEVARAEGVAKANQIVANSITPGYLRYLWVKGMQTNDMQVVYVPTEANIPILEAGKRGDWGDRKE